MGLKQSITHEMAIEAIDRCRSNGYKVRSRIFGEAKANPSPDDAKITEWSDSVKQWAESSLQVLGSLFETDTAGWDFAHASSVIQLSGVDNRASNMLTKTDARLTFLRELIN